MNCTIKYELYYVSVWNSNPVGRDESLSFHPSICQSNHHVLLIYNVNQYYMSMCTSTISLHEGYRSVWISFKSYQGTLNLVSTFARMGVSVQGTGSHEGYVCKGHWFTWMVCQYRTLVRMNDVCAGHLFAWRVCLYSALIHMNGCQYSALVRMMGKSIQGTSSHEGCVCAGH